MYIVYIVYIVYMSKTPNHQSAYLLHNAGLLYATDVLHAGRAHMFVSENVFCDMLEDVSL